MYYIYDTKIQKWRHNSKIHKLGFYLFLSPYAQPYTFIIDVTMRKWLGYVS